MKLSSRILLLMAGIALIAGCSDTGADQFKQPRQTARIIRTTSFHPDADNPRECGEPYDQNDLYPNKTEYLDSYGNTLLEEWFHPAGDVFVYARYYYYNSSNGDLDKVVKWEPPQKPRVAKFVRDKNGGVTEITDNIILPDKYFVKTETKRESPVKKSEVTEDRSTVSEQTPLDGGMVQVQYQTERKDSVSETGSKVYDQQSGHIIHHSGTEYDKGELKRTFGKEYEYTPDGKIARIVAHEGASTGYFNWEYDDHGNWVAYRYYRVPSDGKEYSQDKEYTYNEQGDWTKCIIVTNGTPEAIVLKEYEQIEQ